MERDKAHGVGVAIRKRFLFHREKIPWESVGIVIKHETAKDRPPDRHGREGHGRTEHYPEPFASHHRAATGTPKVVVPITPPRLLAAMPAKVRSASARHVSAAPIPLHPRVAPRARLRRETNLEAGPHVKARDAAAGQSKSASPAVLPTGLSGVGKSVVEAKRGLAADACHVRSLVRALIQAATRGALPYIGIVSESAQLLDTLTQGWNMLAHLCLA